MGDRFTDTRETGFVRNIIGSIKEVAIGLVLLLASFVLLWWNEGRIDMTKVAGTSRAVNAETVDPAADGTFISVTGELKSAKAIGDPWFLEYGPYIALYRKVEMYSWVERKPGEAQKKTEGGQDAETTDSYDKEWCDDPPKSSLFQYPEGHENPAPSVKDQSFFVREASVGAYRCNPQSLRLPLPSPVPITRKAFIPSVNARLDGDYIFVGKGTLRAPDIGNLRISYTGVKSGTTVTLFGKLNGDAVEPYFYKGKRRFFRAIAAPREAAIAQMASEHRVSKGLPRIAGFLMMWVGLCLFFGPVNAALNFVPALGGAGRTVVWPAMFLAALALSLVVMLVSMIAHNVVLLIVSVFAVLVGVWALDRTRPWQRPAKAPAGTGAASPRRELQREQTKPGDEEEAMRLTTKETDSGSETIQFDCDGCGKRYTVKASLAGRKARCKECGHILYIPTESTV